MCLLKSILPYLILLSVIPAYSVKVDAQQKTSKHKPAPKSQSPKPHFEFPILQVREQEKRVPEQEKSINPQPTPSINAESASQTPVIAQPLELRPKRAGIPRIGIATTIRTVPPEQDDAVRAQMYEMLYGNRETSAAEAILLKESLDRSIATEAKMTGCDYVLFLALESTIKPASQKGNGFLNKAIKMGGESLGIVRDTSGYYSNAARATYKGYQIANSLENSTELLGAITEATDKKDKVAIKFKLINVTNNAPVLTETTKDRVAQKKNEPIMQNLLIELGNHVLNSIPIP